MKNAYFYAYLALLCWVPLPLASKSLLAQDFYIILISLLSMACCYQVISQRNLAMPAAFSKAVPAYCLLGISLLWLFIQSLELPLEWIGWLSPVRTQYTGLEANALTSALSFNAFATQHSLLLGLAYFQLFVLTLLLIDNEKRLHTLLYTLVILGAIQATYGGLMTLSGAEKQLWFDKTAHLGVATGTLLNRNHLANYLTYAAAAGIGLLLASARLENVYHWRSFLRSLTQWLLGAKGFLRISLIIIVIGLILTRSRMGNVAFFFSITSTALLWLLLTRKFNRSTLILFGSLLVIDALLVGAWFGIDKVAERIENTSTTEEMRAQMLPYMLNMAHDFWLTFANTFPLYKQEMIGIYWYNEAHFDYLQFVIEFGLIGVLPLMGIVLFSLIKIVQTLRDRQSRLLVATGFTTLMALTASGIHATVEYNLQRPATATLFVIFLALPWITAHLPSNRKRKQLP